jgi:hypothetical protein
MPLEIKELYIRVTVNQPSQAADTASEKKSPPLVPEDKDDLINQCIDEMVKIIKLKKER